MSSTDTADTADTAQPEFTIAPETSNLFSQYAGITNESELREHVIAIHQKAIAAMPYRCIREFRFINLRARRHPFYKTAVSNFVARVNQNPAQQPKLCDLGCALGTDLRQFILDGVPAKSATGIDISDDLISIGFELFRETRESPRQPITWMIANVLDDNVFVNGGPLSNLNDNFELIYTGAVIHLFFEDDVKKFLARAVQMLTPGGTIFGRNVGTKDKPLLMNVPNRAAHLGPSFSYLHTQETIKKVLEDVGLTSIEAWFYERHNEIIRRPEYDVGEKFGILCWKGVKP